MGFFAGLLSLFGCGQKKQPAAQANTTDTLSAASYPKDHKLIAEERKDYSNKFLKQKGVPVLGHLPLIEDHTQARFRDEKEVARKAVVLYGLLHVAHGEKTSKELIVYFKKYDLWNTVSPNEKEYLENPGRTKEEDIQITWRIENLNVLFWALGHFDTLPFPTTMCDFGNYKNLPNLDLDPAEWISKWKLRNKEEILNEADLIYRIHWATRNAGLKRIPMPAGLSEDIVMERHFALNWLIMYAEDWDDITTDT